ncbi:hypothetical protein BaRGS_00029346, partial [Batillaria attramentaria]
CCSALGPVLAKSGQEVVFSWPLPDVIQDKPILVVAFEQPHNAVFITSPATDHVTVMRAYEGRVNITEGMSKGLVQFSMANVTSRDAGKYLCVSGFLENDVVADCGETLVVIDAPRETTVTALAPPVTESPFTLRCSAVSVTSPRDHGLSLKYRWLEASHQNDGDAWTQITGNTHDEGLDLSIDDPEIPDTGSGVVERQPMDDNSGSSELNMEAVSRDDKGRRFACQTSEGLDLWSTMSLPYTVIPEWAPLASDLSLTPTSDSLTLTVGQSASTTCTADCSPLCHIIWQQIKPNNATVTVATSSTLTLANVGWEQEGTYRCVASNVHGSNFTTWSLTVQDPPSSWLSSRTHVIIVVVIATVGVALGMTGAAYVVVACRRRSTPIVWPHQKRDSGRYS